MAGIRKHSNSGFTLVEVMVTMLIALVIAIGAISYMSATAVNAHTADVKATATRLCLLLMEGWKTQTGDILSYDPKVDFDTNTLIPFQEFVEIASPGNPPGLSNTFRYYRIKIDGIQYFVNMSYQGDPPNQRELNVAVAWDRNSTDGTLNYNTLFSVRQTKFASYVVQ